MDGTEILLHSAAARELRPHVAECLNMWIPASRRLCVFGVKVMLFTLNTRLGFCNVAFAQPIYIWPQLGRVVEGQQQFEFTKIIYIYKTIVFDKCHNFCDS